ncbi:MAG: very short patch repair endonuclease [Candidatus Zixiibacteriota bacterium]
MTRSQNMARIKSSGTTSELILRRELWRTGIQYWKNPSWIFGKPDIVVRSVRVAVFCDSEFWHGKKYRKGETPANNRDFWIKKLEGNIQRDRIVNRKLRRDGWTVLRFWEKEIMRHPQLCAQKVKDAISARIGNTE